MSSQDELKKKAAFSAVEFVESDMVVGLGTGSTTRFALLRIADRVQAGELKNIVGIPSSVQTEKLARELGIPLVSLADQAQIDLTIDGADEVDPDLNLIKGGGGALLREKVLAQASRKNIIIVDSSKLSPQLGTCWSLPIEVIPFALKTEEIFLNNLNASVTVRICDDGNWFRTDQNNLILDANFGPIADPKKLAEQLNQRAGIVEHGLFLELATDVIVAAQEGIRHLKRK
ncbi:MAG: ribose-5-phosphate isomerase RpiA [Desulfobacterales bacterium]|nr:ribose-5-phosphate isomerase RpiA [Deltaproteobacteria bacterium]NNL75618.1 ribose-5-phosphate isomerase RpiA [Desulfobacterales bacterium]